MTSRLLALTIIVFLPFIFVSRASAIGAGTCKKMEGVKACKPNPDKPCTGGGQCTEINICCGCGGNNGTKAMVTAGVCVTESCEHHYDEHGVDHPNCSCTQWANSTCQTQPVSCCTDIRSVPATGTKCPPNCHAIDPLPEGCHECDAPVACPHETCP